jgi:UDP-glucose 4-epimerase
MKRIKVVITGGAGFIGSHLVEYWISKGAEVHIMDNLRSGFLSNVQMFPQSIFHNISVNDREKVFEVVRDADYVHHLAAMISVPESIDKPQECVEINVNGLLNVLDACKEYSVKRIVLSSSAAIYGEDPESPKTINMKPAPKSPYGITKLDSEYYLQMYNEQYGLGAVSLRYFNVFGPRQNPKSQYAAVVPIFISKAIRNEPITIYGDGEQTRDFIFVKDVVEANILAVTNPQVNGVFNVALGKATSINQLAQAIIHQINSKSEIIYESERKGDIKHSLASIAETINALNFHPEYDLEEGIKETINFLSKK